MIKLEPGDIVVRYRPKYDKRWYMFWKYLIQRAICFFTTGWWANEHSSNVSHAEMVHSQLSDSEFEVFDMEPPFARFKNRSFKQCMIFRLKNKPADFERKFYAFVNKYYNTKYEYWKLFLFILDWVFHTNWFSRRWDLHHYFVHSEMVAKFYQEDIGIPCSAKDFESVDPDSIMDYCFEEVDTFDLLFNKWR